MPVNVNRGALSWRGETSSQLLTWVNAWRHCKDRGKFTHTKCSFTQSLCETFPALVRLSHSHSVRVSIFLYAVPEFLVADHLVILRIHGRGRYS
jgi:hypothetical protein